VDDRLGRDVGKLGSVGDPVLAFGLPSTVDWQPTRSAPAASAHAAIRRALIASKATQPGTELRQ
jgi:hypothetical protein